MSDTNDRNEIIQAIIGLAKSTGKTVDEILSMRWEDIAKMQEDLEARQKKAVGEGIAYSRVARVMGDSGMPDNMTVDEGIANGFLSEDQVRDAASVTDVEIDATITVMRAEGHEEDHE